MDLRDGMSQRYTFTNSAPLCVHFIMCLVDAAQSAATILAQNTFMQAIHVRESYPLPLLRAFQAQQQSARVRCPPTNVESGRKATVETAMVCSACFSGRLCDRPSATWTEGASPRATCACVDVQLLGRITCQPICRGQCHHSSPH